MAEDNNPKPLGDSPALSSRISFTIIGLTAFTILYIIPRPAGITIEGWRMLTIFLCTILALMLRPLPGVRYRCSYRIAADRALPVARQPKLSPGGEDQGVAGGSRPTDEG